jgi:hypothetical protein
LLQRAAARFAAAVVPFVAPHFGQPRQ